MSSLFNVSYLRNFIFGVEDSLVSTVGLLSGVAITGVPRETLFITGVVLVFVEAFSMAAGSFLSESSAEDYVKRHSGFSRYPYVASLIMFLSYFVSGFIPLAPYIIFPVESAFSISIGLSLLALGVLGVLSGRLARVGLVKSAVRMVLVGGIAIAVGVGVGSVVGL
jgi:VIT1/CCC1 family predicted Fe2+/Mn2+ transporter